MTLVQIADGRSKDRRWMPSFLVAALKRSAENRDMAHLARLDARLLRDIGLTPADLDQWR
ncbi:DUF1127 domain-containing protein [bacterium]|nr:MAG: DUF1127 domain-containing protein [bacterium]